MMHYVLLTVTGDGQVNRSEHPTREEAELAKSLALWGKTPEQVAQRVAGYEEILRQHFAYWEGGRPPRPPTDDERLRLTTTPVCFSNFSYAYINRDGLLQEIEFQSWNNSVTTSPADGQWTRSPPWGGLEVRNRSDVKHAEIIGPVTVEKEKA